MPPSQRPPLKSVTIEAGTSPEFTALSCTKYSTPSSSPEITVPVSSPATLPASSPSETSVQVTAVQKVVSSTCMPSAKPVSFRPPVFSARYW